MAISSNFNMISQIAHLTSDWLLKLVEELVELEVLVKPRLELELEEELEDELLLEMEEELETE